MNVRKIAVVGGFAAGALALALAPLAAAETDGFDFNNILLGEVQSLNSTFEGYAALAGVDAGDITKGDPTLASPLSFDTIDAKDVTGPFATLLYGFNPANAVDDPGSYSLYNGALTEFDNGSNVLVYSLLNNGDLIGEGDLFGSQSVIDAATATGSVAGAAGVFFDAGLADLAGYFS
ncbi:MAG TPA: hypothetical protein VFR17_00410 [Mycobacterium sp.]|nr:hypothetical protein [Mycobacterium sp.]